MHEPVKNRAFDDGEKIAEAVGIVEKDAAFHLTDVPVRTAPVFHVHYILEISGKT